MVARFFRSRGARKFMANRLAVAAFLVIAGYLLVAGLVWFTGIITLEETLGRIGASYQPGLWGAQRSGKRIEDATFWFEVAQNAADRGDFETARGGVAFYERRLTGELDADEIKARVARGIALAKEVLVVEGFDESASVLPKVDEIDAIVVELFPHPEGWDAFMYGARHVLGTDRQGRSISFRAIYSIKVAVQVGVVTALFAVLFGSFVGAAAAFFGGWIDHAVIWLYSTFSSIPYLVLLSVLVYMFNDTSVDKTLIPLYVAFGLTFWVGPCRVIRGETLKIKELEYIQAATAIGFSRTYILIKHVIPNTAHLMFINASLLFIGAIKGEVILSFLGLGVKSGPSWGIMISQSKAEVVSGFFWQIGTATVLMFVLVLAFNILSDALQDAFDPKHV